MGIGRSRPRVLAGASHEHRDAADDDGPRVGITRQPLYESEIVIGAFAAHFDIDPVTRAPDVRVTQAVIGAGVEALVRVDEPKP